MINKIETYTTDSTINYSAAEQAQIYYEEAMELLYNLNLESDQKDEVFKEAEFLIDHAIELDPNYPGFYIVKGALLLGNFQSVEAIENLTKAIELDPQFTDFHFTIHGVAYFIRGIAYVTKHMDRETWEKAMDDFKNFKDLSELMDFINTLDSDSIQSIQSTLVERSQTILFRRA